MTKTQNQIIFFPPPKSVYFFQQHWESEYFFREKKHTPPPLQVKRSFPNWLNYEEIWDLCCFVYPDCTYSTVDYNWYFTSYQLKLDVCWNLFLFSCIWRSISIDVVFSGYSGFLHHDITEILLKVALNTINLTPTKYMIWVYSFDYVVCEILCSIFTWSDFRNDQRYTCCGSRNIYALQHFIKILHM